MMLSGYWLLLAPVIPLLIAMALMIWLGGRSGLLSISPWAAVPALMLALLPWDYTTIQLPSFGIQIGLDQTGRVFLLLSALVWWIGGLHASNRIARTESPRFFIFFLLAMAGNLGVLIAGGIFSFYFCFALMSFAAYGLVIHERHSEALRAGRIYIVFVLLGEVLLLSALMLSVIGGTADDFASIRAAVMASEQRDLIVLLLITSLGIKTGLVGLHFTLPLIYRAAPIAAAAVLAGAMINTGLLGWLRLLPLGEAPLLEWGAVLMTLGMLATFYGVLIGLTQRDARSVLAYSSISQMGILTCAVGLGLSAPHAWPQILMVITLYAVHHGLSKAVLFLGLGVTLHCPDNRRWRCLIGAGLLLPALSLAGAPLTSGMLAKFLLKSEVGVAPVLWVEQLSWLLPLSAFATALLMARFIYLAWPRATDTIKTGSQSENLLSWVSLLVVSLLLVWFLPRPVGQVGNELLSLSLWWSSLWPVLVAAVISVITIKVWGDGKKPIPEIPAGDLLTLIERICQRLLKALAWLTVLQLPRWQERLMKNAKGFVLRTSWDKSIVSLEVGLTRWQVATILFVLLILVVVLLSLPML